MRSRERQLIAMARRITGLDSSWSDAECIDMLRLRIFCAMTHFGK
jgi:hypothetical protein